MAGLVTRSEGVMDGSFQTEGFTADGVHHRVTVPAQLRVLGFQAVDQLEHFQSRVSL
jgi:hypothetical protein